MSISVEPPRTLNIITFNCWGLKYLAKFRNERLKEIGKRIATATPVPDIIGLQEVWTQEDFLSIRLQTESILPNGKFYYSGIFGGGLAILSRWPIEESNMVRYPLNGRPTAFFRGDWFVGKGVACARIRLGPTLSDVVEVFTTHLHAPYEREPNDSYLCHRTAQAWEIAKLMRSAAEKGHLVLALGDFNMVPLSLAHRLITSHAPVQDAWRALHPDSSIGAAIDQAEHQRGRSIPTARFNLVENGATCDSVLNTWRWSKEQQKRLFKGESVKIEDGTQDSRAKRLDYIFVGKPSESKRSQVSGWEVQDVRVGMTERHSKLGCSLSDHFSVEATLFRGTARIWPVTVPATKSSEPHESSCDNPSVIIDTEVVRDIPASTSMHSLPVSTYDEIIAMISIYTMREQRQRRLRLAHLGLSTCLSIGCLVAVWWSPHNFVSFILMMLSTFGLCAGTIDGLIGGLFIGSELRALKEFGWEIANARESARRRQSDEEQLKG